MDQTLHGDCGGGSRTGRLGHDICHRFESEWRAGNRPRIEDYLSAEGGDEPSSFLRDLLEIEVAYRRSAGESPVAEEYSCRFPGRSGAIDEALGRPDRMFTIGQTARDSESAQHGPNRRAHLPGIPGYEVLEELGRGSMGVVYKARHIGLNRAVAVKMLLNGAQERPEWIARFQSEAEMVARLHNQNIIAIYKFDYFDGLPYLEMEYAPGGTLARRIAGVAWEPVRSAELVETLARAIGTAHGHGIIHRDLKPSNVIWGADGRPKIADFGLAKAIQGDSSFTQTGMVLGTPSYMAPEQAEGLNKEVGPAADIYALGAILYELLVGRPPFRAATVDLTMALVRTADPVAPRRLQPGIPADLETICLKALAKAPERRYATADALADDLRRFLDRVPVLARPVGHAERTWRWCRRHPGIAAMSGVLAAVLLAAVLAVAADARTHRILVRKVLAEAEALRSALGDAEQAKRLAHDEARIARDAAERARTLAIDEAKDARKSEQLAREAVAHLRSHDHPDTVLLSTALQNWADQLVHLGRADEAIAPLLESLILRLTGIFDDHKLIADVRRSLADAYSKSGHLDRARLHYEQALSAYRHHPNDPECVVRAGQVVEALARLPAASQSGASGP